MNNHISDYGRSKLPSKSADISHYQIQVSIHQKKGLSKLCRTITVGRANSVDAEVTCVFNFSHTNFN